MKSFEMPPASSQDQKKPSSFAELEVMERVPADALLGVMRDYAKGSGIDAVTVISIIDRTPLTKGEADELLQIAIDGRRKQEELGHREDEIEWSGVISRVRYIASAFPSGGDGGQ